MSSARILILGTSFGGGNWSPLSAVAVALHQARHEVLCFGDEAIAHEFGPAHIPVRAVPSEIALGAFVARWRSEGQTGPSPFQTWGEAALPTVRSIAHDFRPDLLLSEIFTAHLGRLAKLSCAIPWCCVNPGYYFGPGSPRAPETDYVERSLRYRQQFSEAIADADLVLHATDTLFDPPPAYLPKNHVYVGPLWWERPSEPPRYLDDHGAPWVLVTVSSAPQAEEMTLVRIALNTLAARPVRVLLTLSESHKLEEIEVIPPNTHIERFVSHGAVLARSHLLISHAGHGIVMKALYFGVPMVLIPWDRDQPGVAARAAALGAAEVVSREELTETSLSAAIDRVLKDPRYEAQAGAMSTRLRSRDALATARQGIEEFLNDVSLGPKPSEAGRCSPSTRDI